VRKHFVALFAFLILSILVAGPATAGNESSLFVKEGASGKIRYLSGGVGLEERAALKAMSKDYNLKLVFSMTVGEYLSDLMVVIKDGLGDVILHTQSNGPWFFVSLPAGEYSVTAAVNDRKTVRQVKVGHGLQTVHFHWKP
jgi:hypothetical protein